MLSAAILTEGLTKLYGKRPGMQQLDLEVAEAEIFGFIGPNGAGKTTTIRMLMGLLRPTSGKAYVLGLDVEPHSVTVRKEIGYLPGEFGLDPRMTARQLLARSAQLRGMTDLGMGPMLAGRLELDLDLPMGRLSRGNRQKVGLLQALFHRPRLLILDEPTTGLDPLMQDAVLGILREFRDEGCTIFLSSHILSEVQRVCDRVGVVRGNRLVTVETTDSLRAKQQRRVTLVFDRQVDPAPFAELQGVSDVRSDGNAILLRLDDGIDSVVKLASQHTLVDLRVERPSLDEVFLEYYE